MVQVEKNQFKNTAKFIVSLFMLLLFNFQNVNAQCLPIQDEQECCRNGSCLGLVYADYVSNPSLDVFTSSQNGFVINFETYNSHIGTGVFSGTNCCGKFSDNFGIQFKIHKYSI